LAFSRPGTPTDNPYIEAFNGRVRQECLDQQWFYSLEEARICLEEWRKDYNTIRPHTALGNQTPAAYAAAWREQQTNREIGYPYEWTEFWGHVNLAVSHIVCRPNWGSRSPSCSSPAVHLRSWG
jgi:putative transposase